MVTSIVSKDTGPKQLALIMDYKHVAMDISSRPIFCEMWLIFIHVCAYIQVWNKMSTESSFILRSKLMEVF